MNKTFLALALLFSAAAVRADDAAGSRQAKIDSLKAEVAYLQRLQVSLVGKARAATLFNTMMAYQLMVQREAAADQELAKQAELDALLAETKIEAEEVETEPSATVKPLAPPKATLARVSR